MESPSAQLVEPSMIDCDGPPSSPFVTEVDGGQSRGPSKQWKPATSGIIDVQDLYEDYKENVEELVKASPENKLSTPESVQVKFGGSLRRSSKDADLMPPPSARKASGSPIKTPLKSRKEGARTPRSASRGQPFDQSASNFQAGLDARNASLPAEDQGTMDDTAFSTFSEIPDMTVFAKLRPSPTKELRTPRGHGEATPRTSRKRSSPSRSPSPTPRRQKTPATAKSRGDDTTNFLIDFTQQIESFPTQRQLSPAKSATESNLLQYINNQRSPANSTTKSNYATPSKTSNNLMNLLDFELPPAPTPRSVPTITVRELESLKSSYLSQISSLKATLSGREAEVDSLKKAVNDAERRVGEAQETLRDEKNRREHFEQDVESWKRRGVEFESVLKSVKEEVMKGEAEKEDVNRRLEDAEKRVEDGEVRAVKAEERFADALAARAEGGGSADGMEDQVQRLVAAQIDAKIEAVSRELHSVYKEKHERKVGTLKKSYEARNEKKTAELQSRVSELERTNEELQAARDATFSGPAPVASSDEAIELKAGLEEQKAALARLESEMRESRTQQEQLERELKQERIEKGDLVAAVDEMLALQAENPPPPTPSGQRAMSVVEDFRKSISRPSAALSGVKPPGSGSVESKIGRGIPAPAALNRSASGGKSRMLANIERMGRAGSHIAGNGLE